MKKKARVLPPAGSKRLQARRRGGEPTDGPRLQETEGVHPARRSPGRVPEPTAAKENAVPNVPGVPVGAKAGGKTAANENAVAKLVVEAAFELHAGLGPGLLEPVYEVVLAHELRQAGLKVLRQIPIPIVYKGIQFAEGFRADLIVADCLIVELKSVENLNLVHSKQLLTQLRLTGKRLGLLINFGGAQLKGNVQRVANGLSEPLPTF